MKLRGLHITQLVSFGLNVDPAELVFELSKRHPKISTEQYSEIRITLTHPTPNSRSSQSLQSKRQSSHRHQSTRQRSARNHSRRSSLARATSEARSRCLRQTAIALLRQSNRRATRHRCCGRSTDICCSDATVRACTAAFPEDFSWTAVVLVSLAVVHLVVVAGGGGGLGRCDLAGFGLLGWRVVS
jgi:hypothetical protein